MSVQLINLRGVPDDEAEELRELLKTNEIDYYETPAGRWGVSMPAIWLHDSNQLEKAKLLVGKYENERFARVRSEYEALKREGKHRTIIDEIKENPLRVVIYLAIIVVVIYLSTKPFIDIGR